MSENEDTATKNRLTDSTETPPALPDTLSQDERYFLLSVAIRRCKTYRPKFGQGRSNGLNALEFIAPYEAAPLSHWFGIDSPLMYAARRVAVPSVYQHMKGLLLTATTEGTATDTTCIFCRDVRIYQRYHQTIRKRTSKKERFEYVVAVRKSECLHRK